MLPVKTNREEWATKADELHNRAKTTVRHEATLFTKASQAYEICGNSVSSAKCKKREAYIHGRQLHRSDQAALLYHEAARTLCTKVKSASSETERLYDMALTEYCETHRYHLAGRVEEQRAEMRQAATSSRESVDVDGIVKAYESASIYYRADGRIDQANFVDEIRARMLGTIPSRYEEAALIYGELSKAKSMKNLTKTDSRNQLLKAGLLLLASGWSQSALEEKLREVCSDSTVILLHSFDQSRQFQFLQNIAASIEVKDLDVFADHIYFYDDVEPLDPWSLNLLEVMVEKIKKG